MYLGHLGSRKSLILENRPPASFIFLETFSKLPWNINNKCKGMCYGIVHEYEEKQMDYQGQEEHVNGDEPGTKNLYKKEI